MEKWRCNISCNTAMASSPFITSVWLRLIGYQIQFRRGTDCYSRRLTRKISFRDYFRRHRTCILGFCNSRHNVFATYRDPSCRSCCSRNVPFRTWHLRKRKLMCLSTLARAIWNLYNTRVFYVIYCNSTRELLLNFVTSIFLKHAWHQVRVLRSKSGITLRGYYRN